jgi:hypothetical protein
MTSTRRTWQGVPIDERLWGRARRDVRTGCLIFGGALVDGYGVVFFEGRVWRANRLAYTLRVGPIPDGAMILHARVCNGRRACIEPSHLRPGDARQNSADMVAAGRSARGRKLPWAKLNPRLVRAIRRRAPRTSRVSLARRYGVTPSTVSAVALGQTWRWVDPRVAA